MAWWDVRILVWWQTCRRPDVEDAMGKAAAEPGDQALRQYVRGGRTLVDVGIELAVLRRERGLGGEDLAQRGGLPPEIVQELESGTRLPTGDEFTRLATGLGLTAHGLAVLLRPVVQHQASGIRAFG
jgi:ribosome-binding protein aMBF1 (putative translation factor)